MTDRYVHCCDVCGEEAPMDTPWGRGHDEKGQLLSLCPEHYQRCNGCGRKDPDPTHTAYLLDRSTKTGVCLKCKEAIEQNDIDTMTYECFEKLCHAVNGGTSQNLADSMFRTFQRQHRYLQSEFFMALWKFFQQYGALPETHCDLRNEWAVQIAKKWDEAMGVKLQK